MLLLTTAIKPLSPCTTPRRLRVPISRHFLPVLQPEPVAWLTTGLMKGSRRPLALDLLSGVTGCSLADSPSALGVAPLPARIGVPDATVLGTSAAPVFTWTECRGAATEAFFAFRVLFAPVEDGVAVDFVADVALTAVEVTG